MHSPLQPPLTPKNGTLRGIGICRISTDKQDELSLEDQQALARRTMAGCYAGPIDWTFIAGQGSGELLDREESARAEELVESGEFDFVFTEDIGRIFRRIHAYLFCELCEDHDTRLFAPNDNIDTAQDSWRQNAFFACFKHESSNTDTSKRIRRTLDNRFLTGGVIQHVIWGINKPPSCKADADLRLDRRARKIYSGIFWKLERQNASGAAIADWLTLMQVPDRPGGPPAIWTCRKAMRLIRNPWIKGCRIRGRKITRRRNKDGRHVGKKAPPSHQKLRQCNHLVSVRPERYDRVLAMIEARNARYTVGSNGRGDPRKGRPRSKTRWPGQFATCSICGRLYYWGGHGQKDHMQCSGSREHRCWNGVTADGPLAAQRILEAVMRHVEALPEFDQQFLALARQAADRLRDERADKLKQLDARQRELNARIAKLMDQLLRVDSSIITEQIVRLEQDKNQLTAERQRVQRMPVRAAGLRPVAELKQLVVPALAELLNNTTEVPSLITRLIESVAFVPYRLFDGGHPVLRAKVVLNLAPLAGDPGNQLLRRELLVDLFDPPQRVAKRHEVEAALATYPTLTFKQIARDHVRITATAVQKTAVFIHRMRERGLTDPYLQMTEPPVDYGRMRRHDASRYKFAPLGDVGNGSVDSNAGTQPEIPPASG